MKKAGRKDADLNNIHLQLKRIRRCTKAKKKKVLTQDWGQKIEEMIRGLYTFLKELKPSRREE